MSRLRKQGNSIILTIPVSEAENLNLNTEYSVKIDQSGTILLIPKLKNPFVDTDIGQSYEKEIWVEVGSKG